MSLHSMVPGTLTRFKEGVKKGQTEKLRSGGLDVLVGEGGGEPQHPRSSGCLLDKLHRGEQGGGNISPR